MEEYAINHATLRKARKKLNELETSAKTEIEKLPHRKHNFHHSSIRLVNRKIRKQCTRPHILKCLYSYVFENNLVTSDREAQDFATRITQYIMDELETDIVPKIICEYEEDKIIRRVKAKLLKEKKESREFM